MNDPGPVQVAFPADTVAYLRALGADGGAAPPLEAAAADLLRLVLAAVPSCLGVRVTVHRYGIPLSVTARAGPGPVRGSLMLRLPADVPAEPGPVLVVWSGQRGVLAGARRDWLALLDLDPARAVLDDHLVRPAADDDRLGAALADIATVDRALGLLLERRGLLPADGRSLLAADAADTGTSILAAAQALLREPPRLSA